MSLLSRLFGLTPKVMPVALEDATFERDVLRAELPVVIDIWSATCGPCKALEPVMISLATDYHGRVLVAEMATQRCPISVGMLEIRATPTVVYIRDGAVIERVAGFRSSLYHEQAIEELFGIPKKS